jgi:cellulose synthase/poly-beta-1,6-N-acetylglucosamine synthase-like glycosyltransferase
VIFWQIVFVLSLLLLIYVYLGYPVIVCLLGGLRSRPVRKQVFEPFITIVIAAFNEEEHIAATVSNKLQLDYPPEKLEIIVVSDGSADRTDEIVNSFTDQRIKLVRQEPRAGKTSALNLVIPQAAGEIIVFSDANSIYDKGALKALVANFADSEVGYVTGKMIYVNPDGSIIGDGCSAYMKYENFLRTCETRIGSIVGVDGGIDAVRKELYHPMNPDQLPDFVLPLSVVEQGYRVVYEPDALLREDALKAAGDEYRMRVRVSLRALWALWDKRKLLFSDRDKLFAWQLFSHKVARYLCFIFMFLAFVANLSLLEAGFIYRLFFICQVAAYFLAVVSPWLEKRGRQLKIASLCHYFLLINIAAGHAFLKFIRGKKQVVWNPRTG